MQKYPWGHTRRYNDYSNYLRNHFGNRVQKISIDGGFTCPNRDGSKGVGGCTFCNNDTFTSAYCEPILSIGNQITKGVDFFKKNYPGIKYLAYFQSYTNTYGELQHLKDLYEEALSHPEVVGLIVGTRPDCLSDDLLDYFEELNTRTYLTVELGIESTKDETLTKINRGHDFASSREMILELSKRNIRVGSHLILGLPGETREEMLMHASVLSELPINYLKIHQLQYVKGSILGRDFIRNPEQFKVLELEEYIELVIDFLELLRSDIILERFASETPRELQIAPRWGLKNFELVGKVEKRMDQRNTWQGRLYSHKI